MAATVPSGHAGGKRQYLEVRRQGLLCELLEREMRRRCVVARAHEAIPLVALQQLGRLNLRSAPARDGEQQRLQVRRRQALSEQVGDVRDAEAALDPFQNARLDVRHAESLALRRGRRNSRSGGAMSEDWR
jgi:hypothetical protein